MVSPLTRLRGWFVLGLLLSPEPGLAQETTALLGGGGLDWTVWEDGSIADKRGLLEELSVCVEVEGMVDGHHFLDFSGDGVVDLIYSGPDIACDHPVARGERTALLQAKGGEFSEVFVSSGAIVGMWREAPWQPVSLVVRTESCCGDVFVHYSYLYPVQRRGSLGYQEYNHIVFVVDMPLPETVYDAPRPFVIRQGPYNLRATPGIDDDYEWPYSRPFDRTGNVLAAYRYGATGIALGERQSPDGETWWFVLMDVASRPLGIRGYQGAWESAPPRQQLVGWMSPDFLRESIRLPATLDTTRYWRR
jgi:hypothetical protein